MTWYAAAEGTEPTHHPTEAEADAAALKLATLGKKAVVWEIADEETT